jgi:hypothetical protein
MSRFKEMSLIQILEDGMNGDITEVSVEDWYWLNEYINSCIELNRSQASRETKIRMTRGSYEE